MIRLSAPADWLRSISAGLAMIKLLCCGKLFQWKKTFLAAGF
jgi:hypothetical protein